MIIAVASGKGGTGKTTVSASLAQVWGAPVVAVDLDVEEPNLHLFLRPEITSTSQAWLEVPRVVEGACTACGACAGACPDQAITVDGAPPLFDRTACLGCNTCESICPTNAITASEPSARILAGGKLGRHPHLADVIGDAGSPAELVDTVDWIVNDFIQNARPGERFASFWLRDQKQRYFSPQRLKDAARSASPNTNRN